MKNAMPEPVPRITMAPSTCRYLTRKYSVIVFSPHPGTVKAQVKITMPRPRDTLSIDFLQHQKEIVGHIVERK